MSQQLVREHHFYVAIAKSVFSHADYGIVFVHDPITLSAAAEYGLKPLILYGVTVAGTPITWLTFSSVEAPRSFYGVLTEAWSNASGLRGCPDILKVNRHVSDACPELASRLTQAGIQVIVAEPSDKLFPTSLRSAHISALDCAWRCNYSGVPVINNLDLLCAATLASHNLDLNNKPWTYGTTKKSIVERTTQWLTMPVNQIEPIIVVSENTDWAPGPWLSAWEASLPPCAPRYFKNCDGVMWLFSENAGVQSYDEMHDGSIEKAKFMVATWPNKPVEIAKTIGITLRQLQWFLTGRAQLPLRERNLLLALLSIELDEDGFYEAAGPRVLFANTLRTIVSAYEDISHGGDLEYSVEVLPSESLPTDPSWRYLIFQSFGGLPSIIMIQRGGPVSEHINRKHFINFDGMKEIPTAIYRDVVATCARACISPTANMVEMNKFCERRLNELQGLF